ncbi:MAG: hypothetical protein M3137_16125 [Actinomycetota bacterium]|nr:hypothetical protein [Actinomycetota bacterium]
MKTGLPVLGMILGVAATLPPYISPFGHLNLQQRVEVADHVIPGLIVLLVSLAALMLLPRHPPPQPPLLAGGGIITLAGFWMVATHIGLLTQAHQNIVPAGPLAWHLLPSLAVLLLGATWTATLHPLRHH